VWGQSLAGFDSSAAIGVVGVSNASSSDFNPFSPAGVAGDSDINPGVVGSSGQSNGVIGTTQGVGQCGVQGIDSSGGAGIGASAESTTGTALQVAGVATFSRSGTVTVAAGKSSVVVTQARLLSASLVLANLQNLVKGVSIEAVVPNVSAGSFEIYLSKAVPAGDKAIIGWFVVN
jgi:hypothetical protein